MACSSVSAELGQRAGDPAGADLVELVDRAEHLARVVDAEPAVEPLGQPAVVGVHPDRRHRQRRQGFGDDDRELGLVVRRQRPVGDDVDVGLGELPVAALLRPLTPPGLLDLVAPQREGQLAGVLEHVPRERHGEVEVQPEPGVGGVVVIGLQPAEDVDLLGRVALAQQLVQRLDRAGLDRHEPVQLEGPPHRVEQLLLDQPLVRQPFGKTADRRGPRHGLPLVRAVVGLCVGPDQVTDPQVSPRPRCRAG